LRTSEDEDTVDSTREVVSPHRIDSTSPTYYIHYIVWHTDSMKEYDCVYIDYKIKNATPEKPIYQSKNPTTTHLFSANNTVQYKYTTKTRAKNAVKRVYDTQALTISANAAGKTQHQTTMLP